jgi:hypothetical protein
MFTLSIITLICISLIGAVLFIDCKIIDDLPDDNECKKWWRNHIIAPDPKD